VVESARQKGITVTSETKAYLEKVEQIMRQVKATLAPNEYPDDARTGVVMGTVTQMVEHHEAVLLLVRNDKVGSAFALARMVFEGTYRGLWLNFPATEQQVGDFVNTDKLPLSLTELAAAIDEKYHAQGFFEDFRKKSWSALCSYAHTGMLQLGRRFTGSVAQPSYTDEEICGVAQGITTCVILLAAKFLAVHNHGDDTKKMEALIGTYTAPPQVQPGP
jgi:hypothetical protein